MSSSSASKENKTSGRCLANGSGAANNGIEERIQSICWEHIYSDLDRQGFAVIKGLFAPKECRTVVGMYEQETRFRKRIVMENHGYGRGEYKYFAYPLPDIVQELRTAVYPKLVPVANRWNSAMKIDRQYPLEHAEYISICHQAGQVRPTPLILQYAEGDNNCLHQDLYGEHVFPLQLAVLLSAPGEDFGGGEFIITEQRPRMQTKPSVVPLGQGDGVLFAVHHRPVRGSRGNYRVNLKHGVSQLHQGKRHTLGVIFHDAK